MFKVPFLLLTGSIALIPSANAALTVTIGDVTGTNTDLSVVISGSGNTLEDTRPLGSDRLFPAPYGTPSFIGNPAVLNRGNNIGDYVGSAYSSAHYELLASTVTLMDLTNAVSHPLTHMYIDHDGSSGGPNDEFFLAQHPVTSSTPLLAGGTEWKIEETSTILRLQLGNASDFNLGTYSYVDPALGTVTLIVQSASAGATIPEPNIASLICLGVIGQLVRRRR